MKQKITMVYTNKTRHCYFCDKFNAHIKIKAIKGKDKAIKYVCDECFNNKIIDGYLRSLGE